MIVEEEKKIRWSCCSGSEGWKQNQIKIGSAMGLFFPQRWSTLISRCWRSNDDKNVTTTPNCQNQMFRTRRLARGWTGSVNGWCWSIRTTRGPIRREIPGETIEFMMMIQNKNRMMIIIMIRFVTTITMPRPNTAVSHPDLATSIGASGTVSLLQVIVEDIFNVHCHHHHHYCYRHHHHHHHHHHDCHHPQFLTIIVLIIVEAPRRHHYLWFGSGLLPSKQVLMQWFFSLHFFHF